LSKQSLRRAEARCMAMVAVLGVASFLVLQSFTGDFGLFALTAFKSAMAAGFLAPSLRDASRRMVLRQNACRLVGLSLLSSTLPFVLSAFVEPSVGSDARVAVAHATLPLAVTLVGAVWLGARVGCLALAGFVAGLGGAVLLSWQWLFIAEPPLGAAAATRAASAAFPTPTTSALVAALVAALCSVLGNQRSRQEAVAFDPVVLAFAAQGGAVLVLLLPVAWLWPEVGRNAAAWDPVVGIGVVTTTLCFALHHRLRSYP
jgi:hypothetical protein